MRKIKTFNLFESFDDTWDIVDVVKDMLLEISDMDYTTNCVIRRMDGKEYIRIGIAKPTPDWIKTYKHSFTYSDVKEYLEPIISYLSSEGYDWNYNKGTHGQPPKYGNDGPYVVSSGSVLDNDFKSKIEMWFERGFDEVQSNKIKWGF